MNDRETFEEWTQRVWDVSSVTDPEMSAALEAWEARQPEIDALIHDNDNMRKAIVEYDKENAALKAENERLLQALAAVDFTAAPTPPAQEKALADYNEPAMEASWQYLKAQLNQKEWTVSEASNYRGFFACGWEARRQHDAPAQEDEPVAYLAVRRTGTATEKSLLWPTADLEGYKYRGFGLKPLYTRPDSELRKAAEEAFDLLDEFQLGPEQYAVLMELRAALEGK